MAEKYPDTRLKLYRNDENGDTEFNPYKSCVDVQLKAWNCEVIWARSEGQYDDTFQRSWMVHNTPGPHCLGGVSPFTTGRCFSDEKRKAYRCGRFRLC